jgi:hypothetical protein
MRLQFQSISQDYKCFQSESIRLSGLTEKKKSSAKHGIISQEYTQCELIYCDLLDTNLKNKNISKKLKLILKITITDKTLTYASETSTLT